MTVNQHYIPQFYQKYWTCERKGSLWEFDKQHKNNSNKGIRMQSIRSRNSQDNLYESDINNPDNAVENWYGKFETRYSVPYKKLINSRACLCKISDDNKRMLCRLFANFSARNPINLYNNKRNNILASHFTIGEVNPEVDKRIISNIVAFSQGEMMGILYDDEDINSSEMVSDFAKELLSCNVQILVSNKSDIVFCNNLVEQVCYSNEYFFPICPTMLAFFSKNCYLEDKVVRKITPEEYSRFVQLYLNNNMVTRIYANNKCTLEHMI